MDEKKAELITTICKKSVEHKFTLKDMFDIFNAVLKFYFDNARP